MSSPLRAQRKMKPWEEPNPTEKKRDEYINKEEMKFTAMACTPKLCYL